MSSGGRIGIAELPSQLVPAATPAGIPIPGSTLDELERYAIVKALEATGGSTSKAAAILGISVRKIQYKLHEYGSAPRGGARAVANPAGTDGRS
jgi:DNA-binding NtrC family response regulator